VGGSLQDLSLYARSYQHQQPERNVLNTESIVYRNFDNEKKTNRWFAKYETGSVKFGEQVNRIEFQGFDRLEDAQARKMRWM
jgi:hypothetical protein